MGMGNYGFGRTEFFILFGQFLVILCTGVFIIFGDEAYEDEAYRDTKNAHYAMFMDVHCMIFVGFGFLMVFMKSYSWTAVGFNFLIACWACQLTYLLGHFWNYACKWEIREYKEYKYPLDFEMLFMAEFGAAAVLITFGALLGKLNLL